ncbi:hypothetical protein AHAS_Ahas19G0191000 [Arachis hypogaea]
MAHYNGTTNPTTHMSNFKIWMYLAGTSNATRYKAFLTNLTKATQRWFDKGNSLSY